MKQISFACITIYNLLQKNEKVKIAISDHNPLTINLNSYKEYEIY